MLSGLETPPERSLHGITMTLSESLFQLPMTAATPCRATALPIRLMFATADITMTAKRACTISKAGIMTLKPEDSLMRMM